MPGLPFDVPTLRTSGGVDIPQLGLGVYKVPTGQTQQVVETALEIGYRHIDTATLYANEAEVGAALVAAGVPDVFVTTKVWNTDHGYDETLRAFDASLAALRLHALDLYLIHWPMPRVGKFVDTWRALLRLREEGRVRAVGVSNFTPAYIQRLVDETGVSPEVNQIESHPLWPQNDIGEYDTAHGILTEAWAPLARGGSMLAAPVLAGIGARYDKSPAQVVLRWHVQHGRIVIPKSVTPSRIAENIDVFDFELTAAELTAVSALDNGGRTGKDPDLVNSVDGSVDPQPVSAAETIDRASS